MLLNRNIDNFFLIFFYLFPFFVILGPFFSDLYIILINLYFFYLLFFKKKKINIQNKEIIFLFAFYIVLILSSLYNFKYNSTYNDNYFEIIISSLLLIRFPVFLIAIIFLFKNKFNFLYFSKINFIAITLLILSLIFESFFGRDIFFTNNVMENRMSGLFRDELVSGSFLAKFSLFSIPFIFYLNKKYIKLSKPLVLIFIYLLIIIFFIFLTGERISFLHFMLIIGFFCIIIFNVNKIYIITIICFLLSLFFFIFNSIKSTPPVIETAVGNIVKTADETQYFIFNKKLNYSGSIIDRYLSLLIILKSYNTQDYYLLSKHAILIGNKNPLIGNGHKSFRIICSNDNVIMDISKELTCSTHPHNIYTQIYAETGGLGLLFYLTFLIIFIFKYLKLNKSIYKVELNLLFVTFIIIYCLPINITGNIFNNWYSSIIFYSLSIIYLLLNEQNNQQK